MSWRESIEENGFAIIPAVMTCEEITGITDCLTRTSLRRTRAGIRHALQHHEIAALARTPRLVTIAAAVLGAGAFPFRATVFEKSQKANWLVVWHQDTALPLYERKQTPGWGPWSVKEGVTYAHAPAGALSTVLALRVHLDDSTAENGPLRVLPGTHQLGVLDDQTISALTARISQVEGEVTKGGVLAMRPLLVHSSSKSRSEAARRVVHIEYAASRHFADGLELQVAG